MSFFNIDENNISTDEPLKYIYTGISVNHRDIKDRNNDDNLNSIKKQNVPDTEGKLIPIKNTFYQISLRNKEPNFIYAGLSPSSYTAKSVYLFGLLHRNISGITSANNSNVVGEIVVEHTNTNKQLQKVYSCFLIKEIDSNITEENPKGDTTNNSLDKLVDMVNNKLLPEQTFDLSSVIPSQTHSIHYVDGDNHIFVFTNPIVINKDTANFFKTKLAPKTKLFSINPTNESSNKTLFYGSETIVLKKTPKTGDKAKSKEEGFRLLEGVDEDIYIDCSPTGESADTIQAYSTPMDSEYSDHKNQIDGFKMMRHFFMFILIILFSFFTIPKLYKTIIVDRFNNGDPIETRHANIFNADMATIIIFLMNVLVAIPNLIYIVSMFCTMAAGFALIQFNKTRAEFMTTGETNSSYEKEAKFRPNENAGFFKGFGVIFTMLLALWKSGDIQLTEQIIFPFVLFAIVSYFIIQTIVYGIYSVDDDDVGFFDMWRIPLGISVSVISPIIMLVMNPGAIQLAAVAASSSASSNASSSASSSGSGSK